jgi:hypothetical protein
MRGLRGKRRLLVTIGASLVILAIGGAAFAFNLGTTGELNYQLSTSVNNPAGQTTFGSMTCPGARHVTGGGVQVTHNAQVINASRPLDSAADADPVPDDAWGVWVRNEATTGESFQVYAICDN